MAEYFVIYLTFTCTFGNLLIRHSNDIIDTNVSGYLCKTYFVTDKNPSIYKTEILNIPLNGFTLNSFIYFMWGSWLE